MTNCKTISRESRDLSSSTQWKRTAHSTFSLKKEVVKLKLEIEKLEKFMGGIKNMKKLPGALFVVDPKKGKIAVAKQKRHTCSSYR